ncbi:hypothetical protein PUN28_000611 [Cardiocondyla obscurior]|uniref:Uncharacterized protein n=1 Tax=Cardiocondyla obscurior TaxID=286306 RepID=A0AAW2H0B8_9HYME
MSRDRCARPERGRETRENRRERSPAAYANSTPFCSLRRVILSLARRAFPEVSLNRRPRYLGPNGFSALLTINLFKKRYALVARRSESPVERGSLPSGVKEQ